MQFSSFVKTVSGLTILFKNKEPILNVETLKFYTDNSSGLFSKKEFRWSFDNNYWSAWTTLNQGNISTVDISSNSFLYLEIRYTLSSLNSGTVSTFVLNFIEQSNTKTCKQNSIIPDNKCTSIEKNQITNADLLNNKNGDYYLNRTNHKGSQPIASITDLQFILNNIIDSQYNTATNAFNVDGSGTGVLFLHDASTLYFKRLYADPAQGVVITEDSSGNIHFSSNIIVNQDPSINDLYRIKFNEASFGPKFFFDASGFLDVSVSGGSSGKDPSLNIIYPLVFIHENSIGYLNNRVNVIDSSLINLKTYIDGSFGLRDVSISYLNNNKVPYTGALYDLSLGTHDIGSVNAIRFNLNPSTAEIEGQLHYDINNRTLALDLKDGVVLQLGQENHIVCYNLSGQKILNGSPVYISGTNLGLPSVSLAQANSESTSKTIGVATQDILNGFIGYVTSFGLVHDINTSLWPTNTYLYLSEASAGYLTNVAPGAPNTTTFIGTVIISDVSHGSILVNMQQGRSLNSLTDVNISTPLSDQTLKYNGNEWVNGPLSVASAGPGVQFFLDSSNYIIDPSNNQSIPIYQMFKYPIMSASRDVSVSLDSGTSPVLLEKYIYNNSIGGSQIDAGLWTFYTYAYVSNASNTSNISISTFKVVQGSGTVSILGTGTTRRAVVTGDTPFTITDVCTNINCTNSLITPHGVFYITSFGSSTDVSISTLSTYVNESSVGYSNTKFLFNVNTDEINALTPQLYTTTTTQPAFTINSSDKLYIAYYAKTEATSLKSIHYIIQNTQFYTSFVTPLIQRHNDLAGLQGGNSNERFHLTSAELNVVQHTSGINTGDQNLAPYALISYVDGSIFTINSSITNINNYQTIQDNSINNLTNRINTIDSSLISLQTYIDGSLSIRDISINNINQHTISLDSSIIVINASINAIYTQLSSLQTQINDVAAIAYAGLVLGG